MSYATHSRDLRHDPDFICHCSAEEALSECDRWLQARPGGSWPGEGTEAMAACAICMDALRKQFEGVKVEDLLWKL